MVAVHLLEARIKVYEVMKQVQQPRLVAHLYQGAIQQGADCCRS